MHCIIAYAASDRLAPGALTTLKLPRLSALLSRLQAMPAQREPADERPPAAMPHERIHAQALGWDLQAPLPWAAWQQASDPRPQAWITPCHWQIGMDQVFMLDPARLSLSDQESQALLDTLQPYLQGDGLQVRWHDALHWHACGPMLADWHAPSLDRVIGANVRPWITSGLPAALARLGSELQMLAYQHPVNDARLARGALPVNAFWVHGAGRLPQPAAQPRPVLYLDALRAPALAGDASAWQQAWQALDAQLPSADTPNLQLTLCSESAAQTWTARAPGWLNRLRRVVSRPDIPTLLQALVTP